MLTDPVDFTLSLRHREGCGVLLSACLSVSVCLWVCLSARITQKTTRPNFMKFSLYVSVTVARSSDDDSAIRYVLPVLWITQCLHIIGQIHLHLQAWSLRCSELFTVTRLSRGAAKLRTAGEVCCCRLPCFSLHNCCLKMATRSHHGWTRVGLGRVQKFSNFDGSGPVSRIFNMHFVRSFKKRLECSG